MSYYYHFRDYDEEVITCVKKAGLSGSCGNILDKLPEATILVTPGNSFGIMDDGVDRAIRDFFGRDLETQIQELIMKHYNATQGLPVGGCLVIPVKWYHDQKRQKLKYILYMPTMKYPGILPKTTQNARVVFRALECVLTHLPIKGMVLLSGICTGIGMMDATEMVRQLIQ